MRKITLPYICDRMRGFTLPIDGGMLIHDNDEIFRVELAEPVTVASVPGDPYEHEEQAVVFGITLRPPLLEFGSTSVSYAFSPLADKQVVRVTVGNAQEIIRFASLSGDWFVATLTSNASHLVIAEPYLLEVYDLRQ